MNDKTAKILIAEDDITTRMMLSRFIEQQGYQAICAGNGEEALALSHEHIIDLALLDANMPVQDGFQCCRALYQEHGNLLPILMVTGLDDENSIDRAFDAGALDFITKPINWAVLRNRVKFLLQTRRDRLALRQAEARKSALINNALDCIISTTSNGRIVDFNPAAEAFFGYSKEQAQARIKIEHLLPDYSQLVYRTLVQKHLQKNGLSPRHETLAIDRQGDKYTVSLAISQLESDGELITTAMLHDISERKRYEDELRLASTVFNFCNEGIIISDENNVIQAVNPSFSHITGFKAEDVVGRNPNILNSSTHDEAFYEQMWQNINDKGRWQGEVINKRKDGRTYSEWLSICAVGDSDSNKAKNYVAIFSDISKRKAAEEKIWWQAHYDALTQLPNRAMFMAELHKKIDADQPLSLLFIDLDGFKAVNDTLGHNSGDDVLRCVAQRLKNALPGDSLIARLGGDEFTIILNGQSQPEDLHMLSRSLIDKLSAPYELDGDNARLSASIGIARYPDNGIDIDELINLADKMMYEVKTQGKSDVRIA